MSKIHSFLACFLAAALSGCVSITPVKDITNDQTGYLQKEFSPGNINPAVAAKLPQDKTQYRSNEVRITKEMTAETTDKKTDSWKTVETVQNLGNGLFRRKVESISNDITFALFYAVTYKGLLPLRRQEVQLRATNAGAMISAKEIKRIDAIPTPANKEMIVEYTSGNEVQIANFGQGKNVCRYLNSVPAKEIHKSIAGKATQIECEFIDNNNVQSKSQWSYLEEYGFAIQTSFVNSGKKNAVKIIDFKE